MQYESIQRGEGGGGGVLAIGVWFPRNNAFMPNKMVSEATLDYLCRFCEFITAVIYTCMPCQRVNLVTKRGRKVNALACFVWP